MKNFFELSMIACLTVALTTSGLAEETPEASEQTRRVAAKQKLQAQPDVALLYVKGLCCASCAIGIRKKVAKLDFVDKKQFKKGVELDAKTQLVTIGLRKGKTVDNKALAKAIEDAGYDPVHLYALTGDAVTTKPFAAKGYK
jgi:copper chaperone CopZ